MIAEVMLPMGDASTTPDIEQFRLAGVAVSDSGVFREVGTTIPVRPE